VNRRNFLLNFFLWVLSFVFGYKIGQFESTIIIDKDGSLVSEKIGILNKRLADAVSNLEALQLKMGWIDVRDFGAKGDWNGTTGTDDTSAIQKAVNKAIAAKSKLKIPSGKYLITSQIDLTGIAIVTNSDKFGLMIEGSGMGTAIYAKFTSGGQLFNLDAGTSDLQINMRDLACYNIGSTSTIGILVGKVSRYSEFSNVRLDGFKEGYRLRRETYGLVLRNPYIRNCQNQAILVDETTLGAGVITELKIFGGYIDNNGSSVVDGGTASSYLNLYNVQETKFYGTTFEGNFGGGITLRGASENILFDACRFEETHIRFGKGGEIHNIGDEVKNVVFRLCEIAYKKDGVSGTKNYQLFYAGANATLFFEKCQLIDASNTNPSDMFGATDVTADIHMENCITGIDTNYKIQIPDKYNKKSSGMFVITKQIANINALNGSVFEDTDGKLKYKNLAGTITDLTL
jgi:hypothetical protein